LVSAFRKVHTLLSRVGFLKLGLAGLAGLTPFGAPSCAGSRGGGAEGGQDDNNQDNNQDGNELSENEGKSKWNNNANGMTIRAAIIGIMPVTTTRTMTGTTSGTIAKAMTGTMTKATIEAIAEKEAGTTTTAGKPKAEKIGTTTSQEQRGRTLLLLAAQHLIH
jgi:hypothetical protein